MRAALRHALMLVTILSIKWLVGAGLVPFDVAALATPPFTSPAALAQKLWPGRHDKRFDDCVHALVARCPVIVAFMPCPSRWPRPCTNLLPGSPFLYIAGGDRPG